MSTSLLFWIVGNTLPDSEAVLRVLSKVVAVLSFLNYASWTGKRHLVGVLDFIAVHTSVAVFLVSLLGRPLPFLANVVGVVATYFAWRNRRQKSDQICVHLIALFNLFVFGLMAKHVLAAK
jgi:hypothetical protein